MLSGVLGVYTAFASCVAGRNARMINDAIPRDRSDTKQSKAMTKELIVMFMILLAKHAATKLGCLSFLSRIHAAGVTGSVQIFPRRCEALAVFVCRRSYCNRARGNPSRDSSSQVCFVYQEFASRVRLQSDRNASISVLVVCHEHMRRGVPMPSNS